MVHRGHSRCWIVFVSLTVHSLVHTYTHTTQTQHALTHTHTHTHTHTPAHVQRCSYLVSANAPFILLFERGGRR